MGTRAVSTAEPVHLVRRIAIRECGEQLVAIVSACPHVLVDRPRYRYERTLLLREGTAHRLHAASLLLPDAYRLAIIEGWRPAHIQRRMYLTTWRWFEERHPQWSVARLRRTVDRFTAPCGGPVPPPHTTGGAVDLTLTALDGTPCELCAPYDALDPAGYAFAAPRLADPARTNRAVLKRALEAAGITNYPSEYWHWSFGDQGWAYRGGHPAARYGATAPSRYCPPPGEDTDEPLEFEP